MVVFFKQKTAYEMRISDWSSDVCSSDLRARQAEQRLIDALAASPDPFAVFDADERLVLCNQTWADMSGLGDAQLLTGRRFEALLRQVTAGADPAKPGFETNQAFLRWPLPPPPAPDRHTRQIPTREDAQP